MEDILGLLVFGTFFLLYMYSFAKQIKRTFFAIRLNDYNKKIVIVNLICCISYLVFFISYGLNILFFLGVLNLSEKTNSIIFFVWFISLVAIFISRYRLESCD